MKTIRIATALALLTGLVGACSSAGNGEGATPSIDATKFIDSQSTDTGGTTDNPQDRL